jgi:hypothetical protein
MVLATIGGDGNQDRRFLHHTGDGRVRPILVRLEAGRVAGWSVVDYRPAPDGGILLLELLHHGDSIQQWENRIRRITPDGTTMWRRTGAFDLHYTDPAHLIGTYTGLQHPSPDGPLWVIPRATTTGICALDTATGHVTAAPRLDVDVANLIITPTCHALYARMTQDPEHRSPALADTDLTTGHTTLTRPDPPAPLIDLAGLDHAGHLYARTRDGIARINPHWRTRLRGAVHDPNTATTTIAYGTDQPDQIVVAQHQPSPDADSSPTNTWNLPTAHLNATSITLIDIEPGPRFVLHLNGSLHTAGTITTITPEGTTVSITSSHDETTEQLIARENRFDITQTIITPTGVIVTPLANHHGYYLIHLQPTPTE